MTTRDLVHVVRAELESVGPLTGTARRHDADRAAASAVDAVLADARYLEQAVTSGSSSIDEATASAAQLALETTSLLYAAGADHRRWRRWASLSAFGLLLHNEPVEAMQYALLAGETDMAAAFACAPPATRTFGERVVWAFGTGDDEIGTPEPTDWAGAAWRSLFEAVRDHHRARTELALETIVELHVDLYGENWDRFEWRGYPMFDPLAGAAAAVARRGGLVLGIRRHSPVATSTPGWPRATGTAVSRASSVPSPLAAAEGARRMPVRWCPNGGDARSGSWVPTPEPSSTT